MNGNVGVIPAPDHTIEDISLLLRNNQLGTVVVVGDLFHCEEDCEDPSLWRSRIQNTARHEVNWQRILQLDVYVITGHGKMFKTSKISFLSVHVDELLSI